MSKLTGLLCGLSAALALGLCGCSFWSTLHSTAGQKMLLDLFPKSVDEIVGRSDKAIKVAKKSIGSIISLKDSARTFENTVAALDLARREFDIAQNGIRTIKFVHLDKAMRDASQAAVLKMNDFVVDAFLSVDLYRAFKAYAECYAQSEKLNDEQRYFLDESIKGFEHSGLHLPDDKLKKVKSLQKEIFENYLEFSKNVAADKSFISVYEKNLAGVDKSIIDGLKCDKDGNFLVTCDYPTYFGVIKHCSVGDTRCKLNRAFCNRAYPVNKSILEKVISLRDELAKLIGFDGYSNYDISPVMANTSARVKNFLSELSSNVLEKEKAEFELIKKKLPEGVMLRDGKFEPWDEHYSWEQYKKKYYNIDEREIAKYFPVQKTIDGIFSIYQKFLNLKFKEISLPGLWHEDVKVIEVTRNGESSPEGYLLLDLYPRDDKYSHACCISLVSPILPKNGEGKSPSITLIIANFPKPTKDRPSLLKHSDVTTFFHEFGHAMHNLLSRTQMHGFAGYETKHDFVEVPSMMFEEWMWDKGMLKMVSSHYQTGKPLPDDLIEKMVLLKKLTFGGFIHRQCYLSSIALGCFAPGGKKNLDELHESLALRDRPYIHYDPSHHYYASFGHLMGYGAKYYTYMWSLVYALDLFDEIKKQGLLNGKTGDKLIKALLGRGGSVDPNKMLHDFLGRESSQAALLKYVS
jgi:thimet oligopeptidase